MAQAEMREKLQKLGLDGGERVVEPTSDADDFAASVERDLANLPTTEDEYRR